MSTTIQDYSRYGGPSIIDALVGKKITEVRFGEFLLILRTEGGDFLLPVEGDCCSHSYWHDFFGVRLLLEAERIDAAEQVDLSPGDPGYRESTWKVKEDEEEAIAVYGYRLTVDSQFGPRSVVFSFRNLSNGYYGGFLSGERLVDRADERDLLATVAVDRDVIGTDAEGKPIPGTD